MSGFGDDGGRRPSMVDVLRGGLEGARAGAGGASLRALRDLAWRQKYNGAEVYELDLKSGATLRLRQEKRGEVEGLGTGGTVWPAAHVLARHLERREDLGPEGWSVLEIGAGTGAAGLAAAALGATRVALTDLDPILPLCRANAEANASAGRAAKATIDVAAMDWAAPRASRAFEMLDDEGASFDVVIASECVLPQLYPLEPLVDCLAACLGEASLGLVAVEHRTFPAYDPKARFVALAGDRGLDVATVESDRLDETYRADDIEIWEVRRRATTTKAANRREIVVTAWGRGEAELDVCGSRVALREQATGGIGAVSWPSALAAARAFLANLLGMRIGPGTTVLELGAGTGLLAVVLAKLGCAVVATDLPRHVDLLRENLAANVPPDKGKALAKVLVWGEPLPRDLPERIDVVVCADCAYDSTVVEALSETLVALWTRPSGAPLHLVVANEQRTSFDALLRHLAKRYDILPVLVPLIDAEADLWKVQCLPPARQPPPIAIFHSPPPLVDSSDGDD